MGDAFMPGIVYCPQCGAVAEGGTVKCSCCGADIGNKQNQQPSFGYVPPNQNQTNMFAQQQNFNQGNNPQPLQYENYNQYVKNDGAYNGCAITGMIFGILSIVLCCTMWSDLLISAVGIVLSIIGLKSYQYKGCSIAGLVCSIIGLLMSLMILFVIV